MNKLLIALFAILIAATTIFASVAEAGGRGGMRNHFRHMHLIQHNQNDTYKAKKYKKRSYYAAKKRKARKVRVSKTKQAPAPKAKVAKVDESKTEQSSISSGTTEVAVADETKEEVVTATRDLGCKKFFPSAGITLTVPCE